MSNDVDAMDESVQEISAFYYTAADHNILLESDIKTEIVEQQTIYPMPHSPKWCDGMISLRGKIIPVLDLAHTLTAESQSEVHWLLVLESTTLPPIAIKIDSLPARFSYTEDQIKTLKKKQSSSWLTDQVITEQLTLFKADHSILFKQLIADNNDLLSKQNLDTKNQQKTSGDEE